MTRCGLHKTPRDKIVRLSIFDILVVSRSLLVTVRVYAGCLASRNLYVFERIPQSSEFICLWPLRGAPSESRPLLYVENNYFYSYLVQKFKLERF